MKSRVNAVAINTAFGIGQKIITVIANLAIQIVFVRSLGEQYTGISSLFTSLLTVLSFAELGIGNAITYNLYKPIAENDTDRICRYMKLYSTAYKLVALVVFVVGIACCPFLKYIVKGVPDIKESITFIYLFFVVDTAASYLLIYKATFLNACQENFILSIVHTLIAVLKTIFTVIFLLVWKSYYAYLIFTVIATVSQNIIVSKVADKKYPFLKNKNVPSLEKTEMKRIFKDVYAMSLYKVSGTVLKGSDNIIISSGIGTAPLGIMANYNFIIRQISDIILQFFSATTSSIGNLTTENNTEHEHNIFEALNFIAFWLFGFSAIGVYVVAHPFVELCFGEKFVCETAILIALVADLYTTGLMSPVSSFRTSHGLFVQGKYRPAIMAILNITLSIALLKPLGILGVYIATVISRLTTQAWFDPYILYKNVFKKSPFIYYRKYLLRIVVIVACAALTMAVAESVTLNSLWLTVIIRIILCIIIPNTVIAVAFFKTKEFKMVFAMAKSVFFKIFKKEVKAQ